MPKKRNHLADPRFHSFAPDYLQNKLSSVPTHPTQMMRPEGAVPGEPWGVRREAYALVWAECLAKSPVPCRTIDAFPAEPQNFWTPQTQEGSPSSAPSHPSSTQWACLLKVDPSHHALTTSVGTERATEHDCPQLIDLFVILTKGHAWSLGKIKSGTFWAGSTGA